MTKIVGAFAACLAVVGTFATVPEPSTWPMILAGFAGLTFARYRTSRKTAATVA